MTVMLNFIAGGPRPPVLGESRMTALISFEFDFVQVPTVLVWGIHFEGSFWFRFTLDKLQTPFKPSLSSF